MPPPLPAPRLRDTAPELVRCLGLIVGGLAALIARRFLRDPQFSGLIVPLWGWVQRTVQRFGRVRMQAVPKRATRLVVVAAAAAVAVRVRLPGRKAWLVRALGWEAAGYGSQLAALLAEPEMVALLDAVPAVGRVLRPLGRMLGVQVGPVVVKPKPERLPRPKRAVTRKPRRRGLEFSPLSGRPLAMFGAPRPRRLGRSGDGG